MSSIISDFLTETIQIVQEMHGMAYLLLVPEQSFTAFETIFRGVHTLKSGSAMFHFQKTHEISNQLESYLYNLKENSHFVSQVHVAHIQSELDKIESLLHSNDQIGISKESSCDPTSDLFHSVIQMVQDYQVRANKKIEVKWEKCDFKDGFQLISTSQIWSAFVESLIHLVRNSIDHGIESSEERKSNGKPETGVIYISLTLEEDHGTLKVQDDGRGIDTRRVLSQAIQKGIDTSRFCSTSEDEHSAIQLIFSSGFSTAEKVNDISGRGLGLAIVKSRVSELGGNIAVETQLGSGTLFTVQIPFKSSLKPKV